MHVRMGRRWKKLQIIVIVVVKDFVNAWNVKSAFQSAILSKTPSARTMDMNFFLAYTAQFNYCSTTFFETLNVHPFLIGVKSDDSTL